MGTQLTWGVEILGVKISSPTREGVIFQPTILPSAGGRSGTTLPAGNRRQVSENMSTILPVIGFTIRTCPLNLR
jgi:hypothetical protein